MLTFDDVSSLIKMANRQSAATTRNCIIPMTRVDIKSRMWIPKKLTPISRYPNHAPIIRSNNIDIVNSTVKDL